MVKYYARRGDMHRARETFERMRARGIEPTSHVYTRCIPLIGCGFSSISEAISQIIDIPSSNSITKLPGCIIIWSCFRSCHGSLFLFFLLESSTYFCHQESLVLILIYLAVA